MTYDLQTRRKPVPIEASSVQVDGVRAGHVQEVRGVQQAASACHPSEHLFVVPHIAIVAGLPRLWRYCVWWLLNRRRKVLLRIHFHQKEKTKTVFFRLAADLPLPGKGISQSFPRHKQTVYNVTK